MGGVIIMSASAEADKVSLSKAGLIPYCAATGGAAALGSRRRRIAGRAPAVSGLRLKSSDGALAIADSQGIEEIVADCAFRVVAAGAAAPEASLATEAGLAFGWGWAWVGGCG